MYCIISKRFLSIHHGKLVNHSFQFLLFTFQALDRDSQDCPICIMPLTTRTTATSQRSSPAMANRSNRKSVLLSCTHLFHSACLEAFEELSLLEVKVCPVCRSNYQKRPLWTAICVKLLTIFDHGLKLYDPVFRMYVWNYEFTHQSTLTNSASHEQIFSWP